MWFRYLRYTLVCSFNYAITQGSKSVCFSILCHSSHTHLLLLRFPETPSGQDILHLTYLKPPPRKTPHLLFKAQGHFLSSASKQFLCNILLKVVSLKEDFAFIQIRSISQTTKKAHYRKKAKERCVRPPHRKPQNLTEIRLKGALKKWRHILCSRKVQYCKM